MKKQLLNLGKTLNKAEQKSINGGGGKPYICNADGDPVICYFPTVCTLGTNGWYCS